MTKTIHYQESIDIMEVPYCGTEGFTIVTDVFDDVTCKLCIAKKVAAMKAAGIVVKYCNDCGSPMKHRMMKNYFSKMDCYYCPKCMWKNPDTVIIQ